MHLGGRMKSTRRQMSYSGRKKHRRKPCVWVKNNSPLPSEQGIILGCRAAKTYLTNDFIRARENKEMSVGRRQMTQMFRPDLSSDSELPLHLRDSTWPLVIWRRCTHAEYRKRQTAASPAVARHWVIFAKISNDIKRLYEKQTKVPGDGCINPFVALLLKVNRTCKGRIIQRDSFFAEFMKLSVCTVWLHTSWSVCTDLISSPSVCHKFCLDIWTAKPAICIFLHNFQHTPQQFSSCPFF